MDEQLVLILAIVSLMGLFFVTLFSQAVRRLRSLARSTLLESKQPPLYFRLQSFVLNESSIESVLFCTSTVQQVLRVLSLVLVMSLLLPTVAPDFRAFIFLAGFILSFIVVTDSIPRLLAYYFPKPSLTIAIPLASLYFFLFSPFSWLLYRLMGLIIPRESLSPYSEATVSSKEKLLEVIRDVDEANLLNEHDKQLLQSVLTFRDRIVREVMVPRVDLFCLPHDTTIRQAASMLLKEGYSRVPVYKGTQDHILGVLMYKDVLNRFMETEADPQKKALLDEPIEEIVKNVLYTPETKKISVLLQEFRKKQMHLAVVVDEYGGTAGVLTIEDILEEIVGEISDEYDETEKQYWPLQRGGWIVDGRMNLLDLEEETGLKIPQEADYDTMAGYLFYRLGTIPKKGVLLHHDEFDLEILSSGDRFVEKVKITPLLKK